MESPNKLTIAQIITQDLVDTCFDRQQLLDWREEVNTALRLVKTQLADAKANVYQNNTYLDRSTFTKMRTDADRLAIVSQRIQLQLGRLKKADKVAAIHKPIKQQEVRAWLPEELQALDRQLIQKNIELESVRIAFEASISHQKLELGQQIANLEADILELRLARRKSSDAYNQHIASVVRESLGNYQTIYKRLLDEATSRMDGNKHQLINLFPDDMIDALTENRQLVADKQAVQARLHRTIQFLETSRLSLKGTLPMDEFDRRQAFNRLIDKLQHEINRI